MYRVRYFLVHTNSDSAKREKEAVTFAIRVRTMWYEEKVSYFEIVVAKLKETFRNFKFATLCPERSVGTSLWPQRFKI
jgi:predicted nucleotide-binding protein